MRRVGDQLVVLNDVHTADRGLIGELCGLLRVQAGAGLYHVIQQRSVPHSQELAYTINTKLRPLELSKERFREAQVQQLHLPGTGDIAYHRAEHHSKLGAKIRPGIGDTDYELPLVYALWYLYLVGRSLVDADNTAYAALPHLRSLPGHLKPGTGSLLYRKGGCELHHVRRGFCSAVVGRDYKPLSVDGLIHLHYDWVDIHGLCLRSYLVAPFHLFWLSGKFSIFE